MASQLTQLKSRIDALSQETRRTGASLTGFQNTFRSQVTAVEQAIGGSTQRKDKEVVNSLQDAARKVQEATAALERAAQISREYAASL